MRISLRAMSVVLGIVGIWMGAERAEAALDAQVVTIGGEIRERYEFRSNADFDHNKDDALSFVGSRLRCLRPFLSAGRGQFLGDVNGS